MSTTTHQKYYVPHDSAWPIVGALALLLIGYGGATWISQLDQPDARTGPWVFAAGLALLVVTLFGWFGKVIDESQRGLYSAQLDRSFRQCMSWFIFSEVMFFLAFFGALFYARVVSVPWLDGAGNNEMTAEILWPNFEAAWRDCCRMESVSSQPALGLTRLAYSRWTSMVETRQACF